MSGLKVCYVWHDNLLQETNRLPAVEGRAVLVHSLIESYGLLAHMRIVKSSPASYIDLKEFHSELYLDHLKNFTDLDDDEYICNELDEQYGIGYDCTPVSNMFELVQTIAGGSVTAAKCLLLGVADVAINWCGGWHHAQRFRAEGFCYVNDIVIAIEKLRKKFPKVLYVDLDVHHGDGVQDAFNISKSVFTLSFHKYEPGFYPGSGGIEDIGSLNGKGYACNFPFHANYSDDTMEYVFEKVFNPVYSHFKPDAIVVQCGADALALDPYGGATLTARSYCKCIKNVLRKRIPTMLLGGGGYNKPNAARLWTTLTSLVLDISIDDNIPEHNCWPEYGPDYKLSIQPALARDTNHRSYVDEYIRIIKENLQRYLPLEEFEGPDLKRLKLHEEKKENIVSNHKKILNNNNNKVQCIESKDVYEFED